MKYIKNTIITILVIVLLVLLRPIFISYFFNMEYVKVPDLISVQKDEALKVLKSIDLRSVIEPTNSTSVPKDAVVSQFPKAGEIVKVNREIHLVVNSVDNKNFPNVIGMQLVDARRLLSKSNIEIDRVDYYPHTGDKNTVLAVYVDINNLTRSKVSLLVSTAPLNNQNKMPNLVGLPFEYAKLLLKNMGYVISDISYVYDESKPDNIVLVTSPKKGEEIKNGYISIVVNNLNKKIYNNNLDNVIKESLKNEKPNN